MNFLIDVVCKKMNIMIFMFRGGWFMLFNSYIFIFLFLPFALFGYFILNHYSKYAFAEYFLVFMSLWFYAYFNIAYLPIMLLSIIMNYAIGTYMAKSENQKRKFCFMMFGCIINIGILFYYKYLGFTIENMNRMFGTDFTVIKLLLPLGISFFTFQQLSYLIDSYRRKIQIYTFREYALFVSFFPQLIAGPIVLHSETIPQFEDKKKRQFNWDNFSLGIMAFSCGMAKKVLVADTFGNIVNFGFSGIENLSSTNAIFVMLAYTIQIYFDFSGYCDMATGIAKMFNIDLPMNFNSPYKAVTVTDFWKRWHITLTRFLRTYIYFPLGGNRKGNVRTYLNLFLVFLVSGIWHGANYTFILWGMLHGFVMVIERLNKKNIAKIPRAISWCITFLFINIAWVFFRADSIHQAISLFKQILMFNFTPITGDMIHVFGFDGFLYACEQIGEAGILLKTIAPYAMVVVIACILLFCKNTNERIQDFKPTTRNAVACAILLFCSIISLSGVSTFLYFNF